MFRCGKGRLHDHIALPGAPQSLGGQKFLQPFMDLRAEARCHERENSQEGGSVNRRDGTACPEKGEEKSAVREPRQNRTNYRCFRQDLAGFACRHSMAPDSADLLSHPARQATRNPVFPVFSRILQWKAPFTGKLPKNLASPGEIRLVFNFDPL